MRILFVTSNRLGDAVLSTGLLNDLRLSHPDARFTIACGPAAADVFLRMPNRDRTIVLDKRRYRLRWPTLWLEAVRSRWTLLWISAARRLRGWCPRSGAR
jgi:heptosyltransferase III